MSISISFIQQVKNEQFTQKNKVTFCGTQKSDNFSSEYKKRKNRIITNLLHQKNVDKNGIKRLIDCPQEQEFNSLLFGYVQRMTENIEYNHIDRCKDVLVNILNRKGKYTLSEEQYFRNSGVDAYDRLSGLYKAVIEPDKDKEILLVKDILKNKYGVKEMYFNNDVDSAKNWLETAKRVTEYGLNLPDIIITCPYVHSAGTNSMTSKGSMVVINPERAEYTGIESTKHPLHAYVHETVHCNQLSLISFNLLNVPDKFKETSDNISEYAKDNFMHEIHAELKTKQILSELSPIEKEFLDYIER